MVHFITTGVLIDKDEYSRCCEYYWGDITFSEAYQRTKKHVCIMVTASAGSAGAGGANKLLLNHISTPHVLLRSAVAASCALPGIMLPNKLLCKDRAGAVVPFEVDGDNWVDGSFQADVPFKRMATLFSVSNFIVSQVSEAKLS
jgi:TAG lipase/steryl ester hydrolase/phospholipase A2/LPA acyltransferase